MSYKVKPIIILAGGTIIALFVGIAVSVNAKTLERLMRSYKLLPEPETFTELYFEHHLNLPSTVRVNKQQTFSFTIHNLEAKDMVYLYEVFINTNGNKHEIEEKSVNIKNNGSKTISESFTIASPSARSMVVVNLKNLSQQIDFWIETNPSPTVIPTKQLTPTPIATKSIKSKKL